VRTGLPIKCNPARGMRPHTGGVMATAGRHAVVIGASMSGLLAARVLADFYDQVTVFDRDLLPELPEHRRGVPQGEHGHLLLPRGGELLGQMFPGLLGELEAAGVPVVRDDLSEIHFCPGGHVLDTRAAPTRRMEVYLPSRPRLEWQVRRAVRALSNPRMVGDHTVDSLVSNSAGDRVTGVRVIARASGSPQMLAADLVVDAAGRAARTSTWLERLGYRRPTELSIPVGVSYATQLVRMPPGRLREKLVVIGAQPGAPVGLGLFQHENNSWEFTVFGVAGHRLPLEPAQLLSCVRHMAPAHIAEALAGAEALSRVARYRFPVSRWRRFDRMRSLPAGLIAVGDALCCINPTYGHGMTLAAFEAVALADCLRIGTDDLPQRFFRACAPPIDLAWRFAATADRALLGAEAVPLALADRIASAVSDRYLRAATRDPLLSEQFLRVAGMLDPPSAMLRPAALRRLVRLAPRQRKARRSATGRAVRGTRPTEEPGSHRAP